MSKTFSSISSRPKNIASNPKSLANLAKPFETPNESTYQLIFGGETFTSSTKN